MPVLRAYSAGCTIADFRNGKARRGLTADEALSSPSSEPASDMGRLELRSSLRSAVAGAAAAGVWGLQEPLDQRVFGHDYSDVAVLGRR